MIWNSAFQCPDAETPLLSLLGSRMQTSKAEPLHEPVYPVE